MKTDSDIQKDVMQELNWEPQLNATEIGIAVKNGIVTLSGTVNTYAKKRAAESAAKRVVGVRGVAEDIEVKLVSFGKKNDTELAEAITNALRLNVSVPDDKIKVTVDDGWVTLDGDVEWHYQREATKHAVQDLTGVRGVTNRITVKPLIAAKDVKKKISEAFHRSATVDSEKVNVLVEGTKVILTGTVRSFEEEREAVSAAWSAPGVSLVENKILVDSDVYAEY